ncbi:hypothetical protein ACNH6B_06670 [Shewanella basaltis]|uniref:hypothetical protein n=1 Tax=Shewanella basaltis TaxID=472183 RepID=UPI003AAD9421
MKVNHSLKLVLMLYFISHLVAVFFVNLLGFTGFSSTPYIRLFFGLVLIVYFYIFIQNANYQLVIFNDFYMFFRVYVLLGFIWFIIGFSNFNFYFVTDFVYYVIFVLSFFVCAHLLTVDSYFESDLWLFICKLASFSSVFCVVMKVLGVNPPGTILLFIFVVFITIFFTKSNDNVEKYFWIITFSLLALVTVLNRAFYLQAILVFIVASFIRFNVYDYFKYFSFMFLSIVILYFSFDFISEYIIAGTQLERRISETINIFHSGISEEISIPMLQRLYEVQLVTEKFIESPWMLAFGFGFGPVLDMSSSIDASLKGSQLMGAEMTHNIHFLHASLLYRYGVLGVLVYLYMLLKVSRYILFIKKDFYENSLILFSALYILSAFVFSISASSTIYVDPVLPISLAILGASYFRSET